jgi:hypothetical protein
VISSISTGAIVGGLVVQGSQTSLVVAITLSLTSILLAIGSAAEMIVAGLRPANRSEPQPGPPET